MSGVRSSSPDGIHRHVEDRRCRRCRWIRKWSLIPGADLPAAEKYGQTEDGPSDHGAGRGEDPVTEDSLLSSRSCFFCHGFQLLDQDVGVELAGDLGS